MNSVLSDLEMRLMHITAEEAVRLLETVGTVTVTEAVLLGHLKNTLADLDIADTLAREVVGGDA